VLEDLPEIRHQPLARTILAAALPPGRPAHAYLFFGPAGVGKRAVARAFAAGLLAADSPAPQAAYERALRGSHPDLTWVAPTGATAMLVGDIDAAVVGGANLTPLESARRVFVLDGADRLNEQAANKLLKTVEEPPPGVHLILICDREERVLPTLRSRCQQVPFRPLSGEAIVASLSAAGVEPSLAQELAELVDGDGRLARWLASEEGVALRGEIGRVIDGARGGRVGEQPWASLVDRAKAAGERAAQAVLDRYAERLEAASAGERSAVQRERDEAAHRAARRGRLEDLDRSLRIAEAELRRRWREALREPGARPAPNAWERALVATTELRLRLQQNVGEKLALEGYYQRLCNLLSSR